MDQNQYDALVETTKRFALLAETLERNASDAMEQQRRSSASLQQTANDAQTQLQATVRDAGNQLERILGQVVERGLAPGVQQFDVATRGLMRDMQQTGEAARGGQAQLASGLQALLRKANAIGWASVALLILGGCGLLYFQTQLYRDARERTREAEIEARVAEALKQAQVTSCGGRPCLKLDQKSPRWGKKGEYVLLDLDAPEQDRARKPR